jgi:hypothetical protein
MARSRTIEGKRYDLRIWPGQFELANSRGLSGSIAYAMQRHHETGRPYLVSRFGHVLLDCAENRTLMRGNDIGGITCATVSNC